MDYKQSMVYAIETLAKQLKTDFGRLYSSRFTNDQELKDWKNRLWTKAKGLHPQDMLDGYESIVDTKPGRLPEIPEIVAATLVFLKIRVNQEKNQAEADRIALMPPKKEISESVARKNMDKIKKKLGTAFDRMDEHETEQQKKERLIRLEQKRLEHEELLNESFPMRGKDIIPIPSHECHVGWCRKPGTMSNATTGNGNFYCGEHFNRR
jgi:hypothetical protein